MISKTRTCYNMNQCTDSISHSTEESKDINGKQSSVDPSNPETITKYMDQLPIPEVAEPEFCNNKAEGYRICMIETSHQFHSDFPKTKVWGYNGKYPGPTIEAFKDRINYIQWENKLPEEHFLPYDYTLHGTIDSPEVRTVVHVHGAYVEPESDGHPEAWFTRNYALRGPSFAKKVYKYTNHQPATTLWYHDHAMGATRLNVYAGLAGFYLIRDELEERLNLPKGKFEIPLMIQDKTFKADGSLSYPEPVITQGALPPAFKGNTIAVNGKLWPYVEVEPRKYRLRFLNGSNERHYTLSFSKDADIPFHQIGTDGGFLVKTNEIKSFTIYPAERVDTIVDFSKYKNQEIILYNVADDANEHTGCIMKFKVSSKLSEADTSKIPTTLNPYYHIDHHALGAPP